MDVLKIEEAYTRSMQHRHECRCASLAEGHPILRLAIRLACRLRRLRNELCIVDSSGTGVRLHEASCSAQDLGEVIVVKYTF